MKISKFATSYIEKAFKEGISEEIVESKLLNIGLIPSSFKGRSELNEIFKKIKTERCQI